MTVWNSDPSEYFLRNKPFRIKTVQNKRNIDQTWTREVGWARYYQSRLSSLPEQ